MPPACSVRVNGKQTRWFNVESGLRQGCILSPLLFNLYINDLAILIKSLDRGVQIDDGEKLSLLLYADDLCLIADNESDLQLMLDTLQKWCVTWQMKVNDGKTQVVHFRPNSVEKTHITFNCGDSEIKVVDKYKYLGLILTDHLDYQETARVVAQAASRALGLVIAKDKAYGGMHYDCFTTLYTSIVQSVINYGAAIWGTREYSCISAVQNRASRYFMGLGKYAPNIALQGDTGWKHPLHHQWMCITRLWCRLCNMQGSRINKRVFLWASKNKRGWCSRVTKFFHSLDMNHLCDPNELFSTSQTTHAMSECLNRYCEEIWRAKLNREEAQNGPGRNKLRTYRLFKQTICTESYLKVLYSKRDRSALAKFRAGVAPLHIETGRYTRTPEHERFCFNCPNMVESEEHVLICCTVYNDIREKLFDEASRINPAFRDMSDCDKLCYLLSNDEMCIQTSKTLRLILERRRSILYSDR